MRFFNTAGPVNCADHYCLPPLERFDLEAIETLISQKKYFVLHAPRQTGKTTCMLALVEHLNEQGKYTALYCNVENAQAAREDVQAGVATILEDLAAQAEYQLQDTFPRTKKHDILTQAGPFSALNRLLAVWSHYLQTPLVLVLDEIDSLVGDTLIAVLRQLRSGYNQRPKQFPQSVILCGVRDIRDYRIHSSRQKEIITGGSAFNIKAKSLRLGDFIEDEVDALLEQHTRETGQEFTREAKTCLWHLSQGQPWLVNALAYETCFEMKEGRDRSQAIDKIMVDLAKENLIARRETHLDQLADKLQEERVCRVIEGLLSGLQMPQDLPEDDLQYVTDLGLIRRKPQVEIANPIYQEIIPRMLTSSTQDTMNQQTAWYVRNNGDLDVEKLLAAFQGFFREHSEHWLERFQYKEAGPQLLLQAFLQRVVNSGGRVEREYGLGRMRTDLLILWPLSEAESGRPAWTRWQGPIQKAVIECKLLHKSLEQIIDTGLEQTRAYMDGCGAEEGHLIIFDRREGISWKEKIFQRQESFQGTKIMVWGV